jgi:hypothetical protein
MSSLNQTTPHASSFGLTDKQISELMGMSLSWVRKDRITKRLIPFYRLGDAIRYDPETVRGAMLRNMEGGIQ